MKLILLLAVCALTSCATKTDPAFLQQASAALYGVTGGYSSSEGRLMAAPRSQRYSGFSDFFGTP